MMRPSFFSSFAAALSLAVLGAGIPPLHRQNFAMPSGVDILDAPPTSTRRNRNTVAAAKRAALKAKRRKAHRARCR